MSDLQKPAKVDVGQWWLTCAVGLAPFRVEALRGEEMSRVAVHSDGHGETGAWYLMHAATYLGNGEHPAPSDKMIETLAEHIAVITGGTTSSSWPTRTLARLLIDEAETRWADTTERVRLKRAVVSLYRILRARGEW